MSFDTPNIPCSTQISSVHNADKTGCNSIGSANGIVETLTVDSQLLKIFFLCNKENRLNICAILQDVNANFCIDKIEEFMNTIDYDSVKNRQNAIIEQLKFDVLVYGHSKRGNSGIDFELFVNEEYPETEESKQSVCSVSRQLMESINSVIKSTNASNLMFCIECGIRIWNESDCRQHGIDHHKWTLNDEQWGQSGGSNCVVLQAQYENNSECIVNRFTNVDWLDKQFQISMPFLIPSLDHMSYRRDTEQSQSSPSLSILPSWTTATSPCTAMCAVCDSVFTSSLELEEHNRINHQGSNNSGGNRCNNNNNNNRQITTTTREYRCNICNYKTVTKGNLHIHFQSEKHRNNQREHDQNEHVGHIHNQDHSPIPALGSLPQLHMFDSLISRAQNEFFSNIKVTSFPSNWSTIHNNNDQNKDSSAIGLPVDSTLNNMAIFKCDICHNYSHADIEVILDHAERPRPLPSNSEVSKVVRASIDGTSGAELEHVCMLDGYKTRIKANFLLHFKTEKHQQKLQLLAHAGEGGIENANKIMLQMVTEQTSLISIHCSLCRATFSTAHKLRLHVDSSDHQINQKIANSFHIWKKSLESNNNFKEEKVITGFECKPCGSVFRRYIDVLDHFHVQKNSIHMAVFKQEMDINSLVKVHYYNKLDKSELFNGPNQEKTIEKSDILVSLLFRCNLCNDPVDRKELKNHFKEIHKIQDHCADQFINLAEKAHVETISKMLPVFKSLKISEKPKDWSDCVIIKETDNLEPMVRCQQCGKCFATVSLLEEHRTVMKHNDILDHRGHLCYKKGCNQYFKSISLMIDHFYEIHAFQIPEYKRLESFKYICKVCHILAFNCTIKCYQHMNSHSIFGEFDCVFCGLANEGRSSLRSHIESHHVMHEDISCNETKKSSDHIDNTKLDHELKNVSTAITRPDCQSTFSSPESIVNKENRNQTTTKAQEQVTSGRSNLPGSNDILTPRINSLTSISTLISTVGLENVKLVIETMINSKCDQNENDATVWKYAESIIDIANIKETLVEKCRECGKVFSSQAVLKKHDRICINPTTEILQEFERIVSVCREHLNRMMLAFSNDTTRKPLFVTINSHANENFREESAPLQAQSIRPPISCEDALPHFSKFSSASLNMNRSLIQPMINPYRFPPNNHNFLNILPPLGMFPMPHFRFRNLNSPTVPTNLSFFNSKPPVTSSNIIDQKLPDINQKLDNINRKRTQIKNHQYDILRSYFNINNPPNDETIAEIIDKTGLDKKTVKHWFRNTLFKERQRCKDSPYNFNIPPETSLNVEEYEKTGKIEVKSECSRTSSPIDKAKNSDDTKTDASSDDFKIENNKRSNDDVGNEAVVSKLRRIMENKEEATDNNKIDNQLNLTDNKDRFPIIQNFEKLDDKQIININSIIKEKNCLLNKKEGIIIPTSPHNDDTPLDLSYQSSGFSLLNGSRNSFTFDPISPFESEQEPIENCSSNCGERRHRTTLTAMQIQAMKSIFIHCRSPSHNELGILGNVLSLDMRVVQVWFQNQRAKLKKQERDLFYREKPIFPEATQSIIELPNCDRIHCLVCNQNLNPGISKQVHLFSNDHLIILVRYLVTKSNDMKLNWKSESNSL